MIEQPINPGGASERALLLALLRTRGRNGPLRAVAVGLAATLCYVALLAGGYVSQTIGIHPIVAALMINLVVALVAASFHSFINRPVRVVVWAAAALLGYRLLIGSANQSQALSTATQWAIVLAFVAVAVRFEITLRRSIRGVHTALQRDHGSSESSS